MALKMTAEAFNQACLVEVEKQRNEAQNKLVNVLAELNLTQQANAELERNIEALKAQVGDLTAKLVAAGVKKGNKLPPAKAGENA